jgi:hypothetical protein
VWGASLSLWVPRAVNSQPDQSGYVRFMNRDVVAGSAMSERRLVDGMRTAELKKAVVRDTGTLLGSQSGLINSMER